MSPEHPMSLSASSSLRARLDAEIQKAIEWAESSGQRSQAAEMHGLKTELRESLLKRSQRDMDLARQHAANALSAALDAHQEEENSVVAGGSPVPVREPEATPSYVCRCAQPDPVMQADRRFHCYTCSLRVPAVLCEACLVSIAVARRAQNTRMEADHCDGCITASWCSRSGQCLAASSPPERSEGWQPIDSAPKDGRFVLLFSACRAPRFAQNVGKWRDTHGEWYSLDMQVVIDPTHWMPLPAPPEISNG
jgi:hypothetical protein